MDLRAELHEDRALSRQLKYTFPAFLERFGRLLPIQRRVIPEILAGENVLVCSPTASGKTEAVCAPLLERQMQTRSHWMILYVSPTRALINDLFERLGPPMRELSLRLDRRTGDHRSNLRSNPHVLLTTPESFDSLLCRGRRSHGHVLAPVVGVVLDEIHLLHGSARGEHLRWLLARLGRIRAYAMRQGWINDETLQTVALSATVNDPETVAHRYLGANPRIIRWGQERGIQTVSIDTQLPTVEAALPAYLEQLENDEKVLIFCNARRRVDSLTGYLRKRLNRLRYEVRAHHGSLSKRRREKAEAEVRELNRIVVVATSTLEIGIDIGDIDLVVLDGPPPDVPALLQRIGRGNRRTEHTRVMACAGSLAEVIIQSAMIESARKGELGPVERGPNHAVARQQVASYIFQGPRRARSKKSLQTLLEECADPVVSRSLLEHMVSNGDLVEAPDGVRLGHEFLERADTGKIHSNIEQTAALSVIDEASGEVIATGIQFSGGTGLRIGGDFLVVRAWSERRLQVSRTANEALAEGEWGYSSRAWIKGIGQPDTVRRYLGIREGVWPVLDDGRLLTIFHFGGGRRCAVIELLARSTGTAFAIGKVNEWYLRIRREDLAVMEAIRRANATLIELEIPKQLERLEWFLGRPSANKKLPDAVRNDEVKRWLQLESEVIAIQQSSLVAVEERALDAALRLLSMPNRQRMSRILR